METTVAEMTSLIHSPAANQLGLELFSGCFENEDMKNVIYSPRAIAYSAAVLSVGVSAEKQKVLASENIQELLFKPFSATSKCNASITVVMYDPNRIYGTLDHDIASKIESKGLSFISMEYDTNLVNQSQCDGINELAKARTDGKIDDVVNLGIFKDKEMKSMILTVTKFKDIWLKPFTKVSTGMFYITENEHVDIPKMSMNDSLYSIKVNISNMEILFDATIFELQYKSGASMIIHMPNEVVSCGELYDLVAKKYARDDTFEKMLKSFKMESVHRVSIPKFSHSSTLDITNSVLKVNPMQHLLTDHRHLFTHINYEYIKQSIECSIDVDEVGTETTAIHRSWCVDGISPLRTLNVNRPFLYFILDEFKNIVNIGTFVENNDQQ